MDRPPGTRHISAFRCYGNRSRRSQNTTRTAPGGWGWSPRIRGRAGPHRKGFGKDHSVFYPDSSLYALTREISFLRNPGNGARPPNTPPLPTRTRGRVRSGVPPRAFWLVRRRLPPGGCLNRQSRQKARGRWWLFAWRRLKGGPGECRGREKGWDCLGGLLGVLDHQVKIGVLWLLVTQSD